MNRKALVFFCLVVVLAVYVVVVALPEGRPPAAALPVPPHVRALVGTWAGTWQGPHQGHDDVPLPVLVTVETVSSDAATVVYRWGSGERGARGGALRVRAVIQADGSMAWASPGAFRFVLSEDENTLLGLRPYAGHHAFVLLRRADSDASMVATP